MMQYDDALWSPLYDRVLARRVTAEGSTSAVDGKTIMQEEGEHILRKNNNNGVGVYLKPNLDQTPLNQP